MGRKRDYTGFEWEVAGERYLVLRPITRLSKKGVKRFMWQIKHLNCGNEFTVSLACVKGQKKAKCPSCFGAVDFTGFEWEAKGNKYKVLHRDNTAVREDGKKLSKWIVKHIACATEFSVFTPTILAKEMCQCPLCHPKQKWVGKEWKTWKVIEELPSIKTKISTRATPTTTRKFLIKCSVCNQAQEVGLAPISKESNVRCLTCNPVHYVKEGDRFGMLVIVPGTPKRIKLNNINSAFGNLFPCVCDCDPTTVVWKREQSLRGGFVTSCGCKARNQSGANSPTWKGGLTPLHSCIRELGEYKRWRIAVFVRDNRECQVSGLTKVSMQVHHIKPFHKIIEDNNITTVEEAKVCLELWDISNGITLAEEYHSSNSKNPLSFHKLNGTIATEAQFYEWFKNTKIKLGEQ